MREFQLTLLFHIIAKESIPRYVTVKRYVTEVDGGKIM